MLYADNTMLGDTLHSLEVAMSTVDQLGVFSGLLKNWDKSALMLLDNNPIQTITPFCPGPL